MSHFPPINNTFPSVPFQTKAIETPNPGKFSSILEIPDSEAESDSDDEMNDLIESEDEDSESSVESEDDPEGDSESDSDSENEAEDEEPSSDIEMTQTTMTEVEEEDRSEHREIDDGEVKPDAEMRTPGIDKEPKIEIQDPISVQDFSAAFLQSSTVHTPKLSFKELQKQRQQIINGSSKYASIYVPNKSTASDGKAIDPRTKMTDLKHEILSLEKQKAKIEAQIEAREKEVEIEEQKIIAEQVKILLEHNGISQELMDEFEKFKAVIEPLNGKRAGWDITCFGDHRGSYIKYDPGLDLFKQNVEEDHEACHYRCEASKVDGAWIMNENGERVREKECIVEFWPVPSPTSKTGLSLKWGDLFVRIQDTVNFPT